MTTIAPPADPLAPPHRRRGDCADDGGKEHRRRSLGALLLLLLVAVALVVVAATAASMSTISSPAATTAAVVNEGRVRRLSIALPGGGCEITWPKPPKGRIQTAYAASYPGCGARMTWNLIEALTGLWTGDDWDNNKRGRRVVTVKTHYPHDAGKLVSWDDEINRALVIIRNPMNAIPSFFNHIYEIKNNLAIHSQRAPVSDWIEWRDRLAMSQVTKFAKFVDYWMERFDKSNSDRILISYETLTDDNNGPEEAIRISNFLSQSEGVDPIDAELVPCIWRAVVKYKEQLKDTQEKRLDHGRRRLDPLHHDSQRSGPTERPYTPELLDAMSQMLLGLIQKWGDRHMRLRTVLEGYQQDVHAAYLDLINQSPLSSAHPLPGKSYHVYQVSLADGGSTVLNNLLVGLIDPDAAFKNSSVITKTHETNLLELYKNERPKFDEIFFVVLNRGTDPKTRIDDEICTYDNVLCIEYEELLYNNIEELHTMVYNIANKFQSRFEYFFGPGLLDESTRKEAVKRLEIIDNAIAALESRAQIVPDTTFNADGQSASNVKESTRVKVNGKSFHIFQVSSPDTEREMDQILANTAVNWLMGLFDPDGDFSFMINNREQTVRQHDMTVPVDSTVVTKTYISDLIMLYKQYRSTFDEILFVVSGSKAETTADTCQYENVLCIQYEELQFSSPRSMETVVKDMTNKIRARFEYFFGPDFFGNDRVVSAVRRLDGMVQVAPSLANEPFSVTDPKYGIHGRLGNQDGAGAVKHSDLAARQLFYCGGAHGHMKGRTTFRYSTFGLFLAKSLFPEFKFDIEIIQPGDQVKTTATPLNEDTIKSASVDDLLIVHSHQHCDVSVEAFPGIQLHINTEYYDVHPRHVDNVDGKLTMDYLPPGKKTFVIGLHEDTSQSIRVPSCSMRLWFLHMRGKIDMKRIFDPIHKPKNSRENFMLYINSHYIEYRERAARAIADIAPIHTAGKCQGNFEVHPAIPDDNSAVQCVPFDDKNRPPSIQPISGHDGTDRQQDNMDVFSRYRYALVMENSDSPGYVSEKILHAFLSGTVPIYYGSRFVFEIFNAKAFIFFDLDMPHQCLSQIQYYEQNPSEYDKMLNEPILANGQETLERYFSWDETVGNGRLKSRIRQMVGL